MAKATPTGQMRYETMSPMERDICRVLAEMNCTESNEIYGYLCREEDRQIDSVVYHSALSALARHGYLDREMVTDDDGQWEYWYRLTERARREMQREWCWEAREMEQWGDRDE